MEGDLNAEQFQKVLKLCDILVIEDFTVATMLLKQCNWNLERALGVQDGYASAPQPNPKPIQKPKPVQQPKPNPAPAKSQSKVQPNAPKADAKLESSVQKQQKKYEPKPQQKQINDYQDEKHNYQQEEQLQQYYDYPVEQDYNYFEQLQQQDQQQQYYRRQQQAHIQFQNKKKTFNQGFASIPLLKTKSQIMDKNQKSLFLDKQICQNYAKHKVQYQNNLLEKSSILCQRILSSKPQQMKRLYQNLRKNQNNREFLKYLHKKYDSRINFTFGTFLLNLARSYLDNKFLLVYIHKSSHQDSKSVKLLLSQKQIANFINKNCVSYGMFDSSDDYQILQKYVALKDLPNFVLFKFNKKLMSEDFINAYPILQSQPKGFLDWLSANIGVKLKNKINLPEINFQTQQQVAERVELSNIIYSQNEEYQEMARLYELKRQKSQARKQSIQIFDQQIESMRKKFQQQPNFEPGVTIQIKFRLSMSGASLTRNFKLSNKVEQLFEYIHCFGRDQFQERLADFDLTQTFPRLSLKDKKSETICQIFADSQRQNIIVQEL